MYRLAGLFHCIGHEPHKHLLDVDDAARAVTFARLLIPHACAIFVDVGADESVELAKRVWKWIQKNGLLHFRQNEAFAKVKTTRTNTVKQFAPAFELLVAHGYLASEYAKGGPQGGRPSIVCHVNPMAMPST